MQHVVVRDQGRNKVGRRAWSPRPGR